MAENDLPGDNGLAVLSSATRRSAKLIALFLDQVPGELVHFEAAIRAGDAEGLRQVAHKLKGSCRAVGVLRMAVVCESFERSALGGPDVMGSYDKLVAEFERAALLLEAEQALATR